MPDDDYNDDGSEQDDSPVIKDLRKKAAKAEQLEPENVSLRTKVAIYESGLGHLNAAQQKALIGSVEGDPTPEALKTAAATLGFPVDAPPPTEETEQVSDEDKAAHQRAADATSGAEASEAQTKTLEDEIAAAPNEEAVRSILARENMLPNE